MKLLIQVLNLKLMILLEYQYIYTFCKSYNPNWTEDVSAIKKVKITVLWTTVMLSVILMAKKLLEHFTKKD